MKEIIAKLADFKDLSSSEVSDVLERIVTRRVTETQIAAFLLALKMKGETVEETCFIDVKFFGLFGLERWPTFNIADSAIVVCALGLFITILLHEWSEKRKSRNGQ